MEGRTIKDMKKIGKGVNWSKSIIKQKCDIKEIRKVTFK